MTKVKVIETIVEDGYPNGSLTCNNCGWVHHMGEGFKKHIIEHCPNCHSVDYRIQKEVIYWDKTLDRGRKDSGENFYFILDNGLHIRYKTRNIHTTYYSDREFARLMR